MQSFQRGFTIIEILISLIVMGALLGLGVVLMGNMQAQARDKERESDINIIARGLEWRYENKNPVITSVANGAITSSFGYPSVAEIQHALGNSNTNITPSQVANGYMIKLLKGSTDANLKSPTGSALKLLCTSSCTQTDATVISNAVGADGYVYSPIITTSGGTSSVCLTGDCTSYVLYWKSEVDGQIKSLNSKRS